MAKTRFVEFTNGTRNTFAPKKPGDVGHDLHAQIRPNEQSTLDRLLTEFIGWPVVVVWPFSHRTVGSGIAVNMDESTWCEIRARSSTSKRGLHVVGGTIDSGYQGELYTVFSNSSLLPRLIRHNERYAQVVFHKAIRPILKKVSFFFTESARGDTGFGSTGK